MAGPYDIVSADRLGNDVAEGLLDALAPRERLPVVGALMPP